jgi:hypothetical protein
MALLTEQGVLMVGFVMNSRLDIELIQSGNYPLSGNTRWQVNYEDVGDHFLVVVLY